MPAGRPTKYRAEYAEQARKLCLLGATDRDLADFFSVTEQTINGWKKSHPEFLEALREGKELADANVASRLYERALGYEHDDVHVSAHAGEVTLTPIKKRYPPDTQAASLWLRNRCPGLWHDRKEITGADGEPLVPDASPLETARRLAFLLTSAEKLEERDEVKH